MSIFKWDERFETGVPRFDEDHRLMFLLLNEIYDVFFNKGFCSTLSTKIKEFNDHAAQLFLAEEQLMEENQFPGRDEHTIEHARFLQRLGELHDNSVHAQDQFSRNSVLFLGTWLSAHILQSDKLLKFPRANDINDSP